MNLIPTQIIPPIRNPWSRSPRPSSSWYLAGAHWPAALLPMELAAESMKLQAKAPLVLTRKSIRSWSRTLPPMRSLLTGNSLRSTFGRKCVVVLAQFTVLKVLLFSALTCPVFGENTSLFPYLSPCFQAWPHRRNWALRKRLCIRYGKWPVGTGDASALIPLAFRLFQ